MTLQIYRANYSPYQNHQFFRKEEEVLGKLPGVKYVKNISEFDPHLPFVLISNTQTRPTELASSILEKTVLMVHPNSGFDNFEIEFIQNAKFPIVLGNPIRSHAVAEYILSCLFHHFTPITNHHHWDSERKWNRKLLRDQKVLIIGHGTIGQILYKSLTPLCKNLEVYDPYFEVDIDHPHLHKELTDKIISDTSVLILATSLNHKNRHMINDQFLKKLASSVVIVNAARGEIIDEDALEKFMEKNIQTVSFLDVFENEPFKPGHLSSLKRVNKTSHIAGVFEKLNNDIIQFEYHIIKEFLKYYEQGRITDFEQDYSVYLLKNRIRNNELI